MNPRVEKSINRIASEARDRYQAWLDGARSQTEQAAGRVKKGKKSVKTLSQLGVKLTGVSHRATSKVLRQQAKLVEHQIDAFASRLTTAARADGLVDLLRGQLRLVPENASLFVSDTRDTLAIVAGAGGEMRDILVGTVTDVRKKASAPKTTKSKKAPAKTAKPTAERPAATATPESKAAA